MSPSEIRHRHKYICKGKLSFRTIEAAEARILTLRARPKMKDPELLEVYKCLACGKFHCGHRPKYLKEKE